MISSPETRHANIEANICLSMMKFIYFTRRKVKDSVAIVAARLSIVAYPMLDYLGQHCAPRPLAAWLLSQSLRCIENAEFGHNAATL